MFDYTTYLSPFTWRYGSQDMRRLWSEYHKRRLWREIWLALAEAQAEYGLVSPEQLQDLQVHMDDIDVSRSLEIEARIKHDLMAELKAYAEASPLGGGALHMGATSTDIEDNADALRIRQSLNLILEELKGLVTRFARLSQQWADVPIMAFTHLQPAEPTTLGYRLAQYTQDLFEDWQRLSRLHREMRGKGFRGAVGTSASFGELIGLENVQAFEEALSRKLDLPFYPVSTQVYPRKQDYLVVSALADLGASLYRFAFDLRFMQSPPIGELSEPFGRDQVGSSAMPFKRNPIQSEKIDSLSRELAQMPRTAWDNAAHSMLERTLDDSANRRTILPESFLMADELIHITRRVIEGLQVNESQLAQNLARYGPFAASERVLMALGKVGADRQAMHERLRQHAMKAWESVKAGESNPLVEAILGDPEINQYVPEEELRALMEVEGYIGLAPQRARALADMILQAIQ